MENALDWEQAVLILVDVLGIVQGLIMGTYFLIRDNKTYRPTFFLGLFILAYALNIGAYVTGEFYQILHWEGLVYLPLNFSWALFGLFYLYVQHTSLHEHEKPAYWVLYPAIIEFMVDLYIYLQPLEKRFELTESIGFELYYLTGFFFSLFIGVLIIRRIQIHIRRLGDQYSDTKNRELKWAQQFVVVGIAYSLAVLVFNFMEYDFWIELILTTVNVAILYWLAFSGLTHRSTIDLLEMPNQKVSIPMEESKTTLTTGNELVQKIEALLLKEELFTQPDLNIIQLADRVGAHPKQVSTTINKVLHKNFNTLINDYRVEKAKQLLINDRSEQLNMHGIGIESGFKSKSTFYTAFKSRTGNTPLEYARNQQ